MWMGFKFPSNPFWGFMVNCSGPSPFLTVFDGFDGISVSNQPILGFYGTDYRGPILVYFFGAGS